MHRETNPVGHHIDHTGMGAGGEDDQSLVLRIHGEEALVQNQRVRLPALAVLALPVLAGHAPLIGRHARDLAADMEHVVEDGLGLRRAHHVGAMLRQLMNGGDIGESAHRAVRELQGAATEHARMHIGRHIAPAISQANQIEGAEHAAAMVPMAVGEHHRLDPAHLDAEPLDIALEHRLVRPGVEEHGVGLVAAIGGEQAREAMGRVGDAVAAPETQAPAPEAPHLGLDEARGRGQVVGDIVDEDQDLEPVDGRQRCHDQSFLSMKASNSAL
jgi:hypothetical protein